MDSPGCNRVSNSNCRCLPNEQILSSCTRSEWWKDLFLGSRRLESPHPASPMTRPCPRPVSPRAHPYKPKPSASRNFALISEAIPHRPPPPRPSSPHSCLSLWSRPRREELPQPSVLRFQPQPQVEGPGTGRRDQAPRRHAAFVWLQLVCLPLFPPLRRPHASPPFMLKIKGSGTYEMLLRFPSLTIPLAQLPRLLLQTRRGGSMFARASSDCKRRRKKKQNTRAC